MNYGNTENAKIQDILAIMEIESGNMHEKSQTNDDWTGNDRFLPLGSLTVYNTTSSKGNSNERTAGALPT